MANKSKAAKESTLCFFQGWNGHLAPPFRAFTGSTLKEGKRLEPFGMYSTTEFFCIVGDVIIS